MKKIVFFLIISLAVLLRFWNLATVPPSLSHDEVAIGYNAYSVLATGKDEYGISFPVLFRSFDDYKLPGYIYSTVVSMYFFGVNEFAVRFPSALFGSLTVVVFYFFVKNLFGNHGTTRNSLSTDSLALISTGVLAISPWHINFSRAAFESNGSLFFMLLGFSLLFMSIRKKVFLPLAAVSLAISIYFYYTARVVVPILLVIFFVLFFQKYFKQYVGYVVLFLFFFLILLIPLIPHMFTNGLSRVNQVSIFQDKSLTNPYSEARLRNNNSLLSTVVYNRRLAWVHQFSDNYLKNFSPDYYFVNGTGAVGLLYLWELPFFMFGIIRLLFYRNKAILFMVAWFLTVPLVGGLTTGQPNALRTLPNVIPAALFTSYGLIEFVRNMSKYKNIITTVLTGMVLFFLLQFIVLYFDYTPHLTAEHWGDGHKQLAEFIADKQNEYDQIYITGERWRPYIFLLFHMKYQPNKYQQGGAKESFENIRFGSASWDRGGIRLGDEDLKRLANGSVLFVLTKKEFDHQNTLIKNGERKYTLKIISVISGSYTPSSFYAIEVK